MKTIFWLLAISFLLGSTPILGQEKPVKKEDREINTIEEAIQNPEKVLRLNLSNQNIVLTNYDWSKFIHLEYLNLENDHLIEFPIGLTQLKSLKSINLSGNNFKKIPAEFSNLTNLEEIYLNNDQYLDFPKTLDILSKLPKLKTLHLENDNLKSLPEEIKAFKSLESLYLNNNKFKEVPKIQSLDHLKYLDLKNNNIKPELQLQETKDLNFGFKINF